MKENPQPPINPPVEELGITYGSNDYDYDSAKDAELIHRPLVGGSWVSHYEWKVEYAKSRMKLEGTPYRLKSLQRALCNLELARRGYWMERRLTWGKIEYIVHALRDSE